jgi:hypothetical protein
MKQFNFTFSESKRIVEVSDINDHDEKIPCSETTITLKDKIETDADWNLYMRSYMQDILRSGNSVIFKRTTS